METFLASQIKRWTFAIWLLLILVFAGLHAVHLSADFPNNSPWFSDWAKYTDEGWYGNAAVRAHLFGNWYMPGDFNPAPAVPVWPFLEWLLFCFTGVSIEAARGLAVLFFLTSLYLSYLFVRLQASRAAALLAVTFVVTSPFLYCFSRLAILEPMLIALTLAALNLAVRLPRFRRPALTAAGVGLLFTLMMLTKTTAVFLLPAIGWAMVASLWPNRRVAVSCCVAAAGTFLGTFGIWMALVIHAGLLPDYKYLFFVNKYVKPSEFYWPLLSLWWSIHGGLWVDRILIPLAGLVPLSVVLSWRAPWSRTLRRNPAFGTSLWAVAGYILFMTYQNHPQPRYFTVVAFFSCFVLALGIDAFWSSSRTDSLGADGRKQSPPKGGRIPFSRRPVLGIALAAAAGIAVLLNGEWTLEFVLHPEYTFVQAAGKLTQYIDQHPNGKRLLVSTSGDEISMMTHLPSICDDFGTLDLVTKLGHYQPGWFATWNDLDPGTLEDLHNHFSLEQVASFHALDDPDRDVLVLFKLHPLPNGEKRDPSAMNLQVALPGDKIGIPIE